MAKPLLEVVAAAIYDHRGQLLLAQRHDDGSVEAGLWEFPGGKVETGESPAAALRRELDEELELSAICVEAIPGARCEDHDRGIALSLWRAQVGVQQPQCLVHQRLRWLRPEHCIELPLGHLDRQLARWAAVPSRYHITPADWHGRSPRPVTSASAQRPWLLARWPGVTDADYGKRLQQLLQDSADSPLPVMLHDRFPEDEAAPVVGCHLSSRAAARYDQRPIGRQHWLAVSCHSEAELAHAADIDADFVVLGPVRPTTSHRNQPGMGWASLAELCGQAKMPVLALGGVSLTDIGEARAHGCVGVAGISAFWC